MNGPAARYAFSMDADTAQCLGQCSRRAIRCVKKAIAKWSGYDQMSGHTGDTGANNVVNEPRYIDGSEHRIACGGEYQIAVQCPRLFVERAVGIKTRLEVIFGTEFRKSGKRGCDFNY